MKEQAAIVCMKWGAKYGADDVNQLWLMLRNQSRQNFALTCFTDDPSGLRPEINYRPLPPVSIPAGSPERGWNKLGMFWPGIELARAPTLFLDLDVILTGNIDVFFELDGLFRIADDCDWRKPGVGNTSAFRFVPGTQNQIWQTFEDNPRAALASFRNEQEFVSALASGRQFWPPSLVRSYKRHCLPLWPLGFFKTSRLPPDARVLMFHGDPKPADAIKGVSRKWYRPLRPAPWLNDFLSTA